MADQKSKKERLAEIDFWRGMAVIGMIIYHFFFVFNFQGLLIQDMHSFWWTVLARLVQFSFLGLVGVSFVLARGRSWDFYRKEFKRGLICVFFALMISLVSYLVVPEVWVQFGILHFIAFSILFLSPLSKRPLLSFILGITAILVGSYISAIETENLFLFILGFNGPFASLDYFSIFPWSAVVLFGISFGHLYLALLKDHFSALRRVLKESVWGRVVIYLGRKSLIIYVIHVPIIYLISILYENYFS